MSTSTTRFLQQENIRLQKENEALQQKNRTLVRYLDMVKELYWFNQQIVFEADPLDVLDQLLDKTINVIGANDGSLSYLDEAAGELVFVLVHGDLREQLPGYRIKSEIGVAGWVVSNKRPIIVNNPRQDWRFSLEVDQDFSFSTRSIVSVPVIAQSKPIGVIQFVNKRNNEFTESDVALLLTLSQVATKALEAAPPQLEAREGEKDDNLLFDD
jgi:GAF domain-containing protein